MDVQSKAVEITTNALKDGTFFEKAENAGRNCFAYPCEIDIEGNGETTEVWVTIDLTCKKWKPYNSKGTIYPPYNPFDVENEWQSTLAERERKAKEIAEKKAKKIAKQKNAKVKGE